MAVAACAEELGLKIIEVNAGSLRSGRQLLGSLQEATQSHRVTVPTVVGSKSEPIVIDESPSKPDVIELNSSSPVKLSPVRSSRSVRKRLPEQDQESSSEDVDDEPSSDVFVKAKKAKKASSPVPQPPHDGAKLKPLGKISDFFSSAAAKRPKQAEAPKPIPSTSAELAGNSPAQSTLLVFEDVDIVFDEDQVQSQSFVDYASHIAGLLEGRRGLDGKLQAPDHFHMQW